MAWSPNPTAIPSPGAADPDIIRARSSIDFLNHRSRRSFIDHHRSRRGRARRGTLRRGHGGGHRRRLRRRRRVRRRNSVSSAGRRIRNGPVRMNPLPSISMLGPISGLPNRVRGRRALPRGGKPNPAAAGGVPFIMTSHPNQARGRRVGRRNLRRYRLLNNDHALRGGIVVNGKTKIKTETDSRIAKSGDWKRQQSRGKESFLGCHSAGVR